MLSRQTHICVLTHNAFLPSHRVASLRWGSGWAAASPPCHPEAWFLLCCCLPSARSCPGLHGQFWLTGRCPPYSLRKAREGEGRLSCIIPLLGLLAGLSHMAADIAAREVAMPSLLAGCASCYNSDCLSPFGLL